MESKKISRYVSLSISKEVRQDLRDIKRQKKDNSVETFNEVIQNLYYEHLMLSFLRSDPDFKKFVSKILGNKKIENEIVENYQSLHDYLWTIFWTWHKPNKQGVKNE